MENTKPFYESRTILGAIPGIAVMLKLMLDVDISELELTQLLEAALVIASIAVMIYGRIRANSKLTLLPTKKTGIE